jgi:hypothetical protein
VFEACSVKFNAKIAAEKACPSTPLRSGRDDRLYWTWSELGSYPSHTTRKP